MGQARRRKPGASASGEGSNGVLKEEKTKGRLLSWDEIPNWYQDNEYILSGYRAVSNSYPSSLKSILAIHNETVNIQSHLLGAILFFTLPFVLYESLQSRYDSASTADVVVFSTFFSGVTICFLLSSIFHILNNHSQRIHIFGNQLDYLGIVLLMWGSTIPSVYYGFFCTPALQTLYYSLVTLLAALCTYATLHPRFRARHYRPYRTLMYAGLGLSFVIPIVHGVVRFGWEVQRRRMSLGWLGVMTGFNLVGAGVYALRIPEKWYPRRFDIWGASHQVMHCLVICAGIAHLFGLLEAFDHVHSQEKVCG